MKTKGIRVVILLVVMLMMVSGCTGSSGGTQKKEEQTSENDSIKTKEDTKYVTYKKADIIENVEKLNTKIGMESLMLSRIIKLEDIEKYLPIDNIRKITGGFLIEYPMEDSEFAIITDGDGVVFGSFLRCEELHTNMELETVKEGMTLEGLKKVFPEISVDATAEKVLRENKHKNDEIICEVMLENYQYGRVTLKNKKEKIVVTKVETMDMPFPKDTMKEVFAQNPEALESRYIVVTNNGKIVFGKKQWNEFYMETTRGLSNLAGQMQKKEMLKMQNVSICVKNYYNDTELLEGKKQDGIDGVVESMIVYDGNQFLLNKEGKEILQYKYLIERKGRMNNADIGENGFYLVNDKNLTYEQLMWSVMSSQSSDWIDYYTVFWEEYYDE